MALNATQDCFGQWGFVDDEGDWVIQPMFDSVSPFRGEYAKAVKDGKDCYINKDGHWFDEIPWFDKPEGATDESDRSPKEIIDECFSKISGILHKGLSDL